MNKSEGDQKRSPAQSGNTVHSNTSWLIPTSFSILIFLLYVSFFSLFHYIFIRAHKFFLIYFFWLLHWLLILLEEHVNNFEPFINYIVSWKLTIREC